MKSKTETGVAQSAKPKQAYLEYIRAAATIAVVFLHVAAALTNNYSPEELGLSNFIFFNGCHMLVTWAVPCFLMISGALLLNPERNVDFKKITGYIIRMLWILLTFGVVYALMELVFESRTISVGMLLQAVLNTAEGKSWDHLWYIYMLISMYLITIPLRCYIEKTGEYGVKWLLGALLIGTSVIPSINAVFHVELENYMILTGYTTYYLLGWFLSNLKTKRSWIFAASYAAATLCIILLENWSLNTHGEQFEVNHFPSGILVMIQSVSVFLFVKCAAECWNFRLGRICKLICVCSFGIYLIHPFHINLVYKAMGITPLSMSNLPLAVIFFTVVMLGLSLISTLVLKKIPFIKKIV